MGTTEYCISVMVRLIFIILRYLQREDTASAKRLRSDPMMVFYVCLILVIIILVRSFRMNLSVDFVLRDGGNIEHLHRDPKVLQNDAFRKAVKIRQFQLVFHDVIFYLKAPSFEIKRLELFIWQIEKIGNQHFNLAARQSELENTHANIAVHGDNMTSQRQFVNHSIEFCTNSN